MRRIFLLLAITFFMSACATTENYEAKLKTWVGSDINNLITSWGPPSDEYKMPNGNIMYTWLRVGNTMVISNYNQYTNTVLTSSVRHWCKTTFTVNSAGTIRNWRWEGNSCRSSN